MNTPHDYSKGTWVIPYTTMTLADGTFLVRPGKPILRASSKLTAKWTGVSASTLWRLAETGLIRCAMPTAKSKLYYPAEVEEFIRATEENPDYWDEVKRKAFIKTRCLRSNRKNETN